MDASNGMHRVVLTNVRVFNGTNFTDTGETAVVIDGETIGSDASGAEVVDCKGGFLLPGLFDAHVHLDFEHDLRVMAKYGITTCLDMATWPHSKLQGLRDLPRRGLPEFRSPGIIATVDGTTHSATLPIPKEEFISDPDAARKFVSRRMAEKVDYIKIIADIPGPNQASMNALVVEAHNSGKKVIAHASAYIPFQMAQDAQVDIVTHVPRNQALDAAACDRMRRDKRICVPTLAMMEAVTKPPASVLAMLWFILTHLRFAWIMFKNRKTRSKASGPEQYQNARESVRALHAAGVPILAGTDSHADNLLPFIVKHGDALHRELELLVEAGLSNAEALRSATDLPAKYFNFPDRGVIELGKRADLALLSRNPLDDISNTRSIEKVWLAGVEVSV